MRGRSTQACSAQICLELCNDRSRRLTSLNLELWSGEGCGVGAEARLGDGQQGWGSLAGVRWHGKGQGQAIGDEDTNEESANVI